MSHFLGTEQDIGKFVDPNPQNGAYPPNPCLLFELPIILRAERELEFVTPPSLFTCLLLEKPGTTFLPLNFKSFPETMLFFCGNDILGVEFPKEFLALLAERFGRLNDLTPILILLPFTIGEIVLLFELVDVGTI